MPVHIRLTAACVVSALNIDLAGRGVVVTGGASGIGRAVVNAALACGARVASIDLDPEAGRQLREELGTAVVTMDADVSSEGACAEAFQAVNDSMGAPAVLVNSAGILQPSGGTLRQDLASWRRVIDVNLQGTFLATREVARFMAPTGRGSVINICSVAGLVGFRASNSYGVSKAGVAMLTKTLALDFASKGIRVNAVAPGFIDTSMVQSLEAQSSVAQASLTKRTPLGRYGTAAEVAATIMFLASDLASFVTGAVWTVDGGWTAFGGAGDAS